MREVVSLERMGAEGGVNWEEHGVDASDASALARGDELKEVLLNVLENARLARRAHACACRSHSAATSTATAVC